MDYKEIIKTSLQVLKRNTLRTSLTMLGIVIGITSVILIVSIGQGAVKFITDELASFGTDYFQINPGSSQFSSFAGTNTLTLDDVDAIRDDPSLTNVNKVIPVALQSARVTANDEAETINISGTTTDAPEILKPVIIYGEFLADENTSEHVTVLGSETAETFFGEDTDPTGERVRINGTPYLVIGVAHFESALAGSVLNNSLFVPINVMFLEIIGEERIQEINVSVHDTDLINQTISDVEILLRDRHDLDEADENDFRISSAEDILSTVETITSLLTLMIAAISGISLVVGGVGVMNIMLVSVTERTKEIGLLKAIGAKESDILTQFLIEAVVMTISGGIIGIILGVSGAFVISKIAGIPFVVSPLAVILAVAVSSLVGIAFGLYPARKAARLSPIDALRYE
jgi:putative ABC transport system permease protein